MGAPVLRVGSRSASESGGGRCAMMTGMAGTRLLSANSWDTPQCVSGNCLLAMGTVFARPIWHFLHFISFGHAMYGSLHSFSSGRGQHKC